MIKPNNKPIDLNTKLDLSKIGPISNCVKDFYTNKKGKEEVSDGMTCKRCRNFSPMAEANQQDGSFLCWSCRSTMA